MTSVDGPARPVGRGDIERKLREIRGEVDTATQSARSVVLVAGAAVAVVVVGVAFFLGRRKGNKESTLVEIRRV